ncbi:MAG: pitrilysin family protein, partial [Pyrinomonadaceae bacterium]
MKKTKKHGFCSIKAYFSALFLSSLISCAGATALAQNAPEPRREQLLNGLQVLYLPRPADANVFLKLRIHSGAAFDMAGKAGTMALLGDALFPDASTREYFTDELGGRLEVTTNYDSINITLSGKAQKFEGIIDLLHNALINTQLNAEMVNRLRDARLKLIQETSIAPTSIADRAASARLFGDFPYGRPFSGSTETMARIDRADLLLARERFLNSNNATLVIIGGVEERRAMRALRQLLGIWRKSEQIVPATFRQPEKPDARIQIVDLPGAETAEVRFAARSLARSDRDYWAATLLALIAHDRLQASHPALAKSPFFVRNEAHKLPGAFVFGATVPVASVADTLAAARNAARSFITIPPTAAELERARSEALALFNKQMEQTDTLADLWLDRETYKLDSISEQANVLKNVTAVEVQGLATRLFRDAAFATVVVGSAAQLKPLLSSAGEVEI